jgi:hypothetical protein
VITNLIKGSAWRQRGNCAQESLYHPPDRFLNLQKLITLNKGVSSKQDQSCNAASVIRRALNAQLDTPLDALFDRPVAERDALQSGNETKKPLM